MAVKLATLHVCLYKTNAGGGSAKQAGPLLLVDPGVVRAIKGTQLDACAILIDGVWEVVYESLTETKTILGLI